jgi:hypothetical protein
MFAQPLTDPVFDGALPAEFSPPRSRLTHPLCLDSTHALLFLTLGFRLTPTSLS